MYNAVRGAVKTRSAFSTHFFQTRETITLRNQNRQPRVLAIGVFDGVHLGHQVLLKALVKMARRQKARTVVLTFLSHPEDVLSGSPRVPFLLERDETFKLLERFGAREVRLIPFTRAFARKNPAGFIAWLTRRFNLRGVVVGSGFRFGRGAQGNTAFLRREGKRLGFEVVTVPPVRRGGRVVSSSRIRACLRSGRLTEANRLLGRPYELDGVVGHGRHVGHKLGFPTANLVRIPQALPKDGVYACAVPIGKTTYRAGMNLGHRPTFQDDDHHRSAEVHLLGYRDRSLYGKMLRVRLLRYIRPERKFVSPRALARQIQKDLRAIRR